jgi:3-oxoadipate enol-lactonase
MAYVTADGTSLFVDHAGDGAPLLLLHEFSLDHRQWSPQWADLTATHQAFRLDRRAHGASAAPPGGYNHAGQARDVQRVMVQIGMDRLNPGWIVAHSFAADAALQAALAEPRALHGVVVVTPAVWGHAWSEAWQAAWNTWRDLARGGDSSGALASFRATSLFDGVRAVPELAALVERMQAEADDGVPTLERLAACKVPVLVVATPNDGADFVQCGHEIVAATPGARRVEIAAAGHFPNLERPAEFTAVLREFLAIA